MAVVPKPFRRGPDGRRETSAISTAPTITRIDSNASRLPGGIPVTVYGTNFRKGPAGELPIVSFDGYAAAGGVPTADGTQITGVIVPPSIGVGGGTPIIGYVDVTVEVFGPDQTATLLSGFLYYTGQMTAIDPPYAPTSGGVAVIVKGASFIAASTFTFGGVPATSVVQIDDTHYSVVVPAHVAGYVDVVMTESGGGTFTLRNGFQYTTLTRGTDIRRFPGTVINKTLGGMTPDSATFSIDGQSHKPVAGEEISISDDVTLDELFDGIMMSADQVYEGQIDQLVWRCTASDFTYILNKYRPFGSYFLVSASEVVRDLMGKYAPSFNLDFVQTKLALISISLDGTRTMSEVLTAIANAIGGGRWRLEGRALHFFNPPAPSVITIPAGETGTGADFTACTLAAGAAVSLGNSYVAGNYCLRVTFLYSNGLESRLGPTSNVIAFDGTKYFHITGVPVGLDPGGGITCVGRKLYYLRNADQLASGWTINDNATTALDVIPVLHALASTGTVSVDIGEPVTAPDAGTDGAFPATIPVTGNSQGMQIVGPYVTVRGSTNQGDYGYDSNAGYCTSLAIAGQPTQDDITQHKNFYQGGGFYINFQTALGFYQFSNTAIYSDGGESLPTQWSVSVFLGQGLAAGFGQYRNYCAWWTTPQTFPLVNGKKPIKFRIYIRCIALRPTIAGAGGSGGSADIQIPNPLTQLLGEVPYFETPTGAGNIPLSAGGSALDTTGSVNSPSESFDFSIQPPQVANAVEQTYVWPNPDGPYLEDYDNPHDIDDDDEDLLHADSGSQPFVSTEDITQLRNRVKVFGASTITTADAAVGDSAVQIANPGIASVNGGKLLAANGVTLDYFSTSSPETSTSKNAALLLRTPLTQAIPAGTLVQYYSMAEDVDSQRRRGKIELDELGNPTDGVHEYVINDPSLASVQAVYLRSHAEIAVYKDPIITVKYATRNRTRPGARVTVNLTNPPCSGTFMVQSVVIDQIRDEGDQLAPRYTVVASTVLYDLTNFLLLLTGGNQISGGGSSTQSSIQGGGGSSSQVGVQEAAVSQASASSTAITDILGALKGYVQYAAYNATNGSFSNVVGSVSPSFAGGVSAGSNVLDLRGVWARCRTSALLNASGGYSQTGTFIRAEHNPRVRFYMRTGDSLSAMRFFAGCCGGGVGTFANTDIQANKSFGVRYSTAANDGGFRVFSSDGTTMTLSATFFTPAPNSEYLVDIQVSGGGTLVTATITDVNGTVYTTNVSIANSVLQNNMAPLCTFYTLEAVSKTIDYLHLGFSFGLN